MAKKKIKNKLSIEEKEELKQEGELPSGNVRNKETRQLIWFFAIIIAVFAAFLIPYFWVDSSKHFEFANAEWVFEEYENLNIYHGKIPIYYQGQLYVTFNLYLRNDPRKNDIPADINISFFPNIVVSQSEEVMNCPDSILVSSGLGQIGSMIPFVKGVSGAMSSEEGAERWNVPFADCSSAGNGKTVIMVRMSPDGKSSVSFDESNSDCYSLNVGSCEDNLMVSEKFMLEIISQLEN